jgi:hypothetical protein
MTSSRRSSDSAQLGKCELARGQHNAPPPPLFPPILFNVPNHPNSTHQPSHRKAYGMISKHRKQRKEGERESHTHTQRQDCPTTNKKYPHDLRRVRRQSQGLTKVRQRFAATSAQPSTQTQSSRTQALAFSQTAAPCGAQQLSLTRSARSCSAAWPSRSRPPQGREGASRPW